MRQQSRIPGRHGESRFGRIEDRLTSLALKEVPSEKLGELVIRELRKMDKVAYIRYASVYKNFEDVDEFADAIAEVAPRTTSTKKTAVKPKK